MSNENKQTNKPKKKKKEKIKKQFQKRYKTQKTHFIRIQKKKMNEKCFKKQKNKIK